MKEKLMRKCWFIFVEFLRGLEISSFSYSVGEESDKKLVEKICMGNS